MQKIIALCEEAAAEIVARYRAEAPTGFDPEAKGGVPKPQPPPKPPMPQDAAGPADQKTRALKRQGFMSTILTGGLGDSNADSAKKTLLGS